MFFLGCVAVSFATLSVIFYWLWVVANRSAKEYYNLYHKLHTAICDISSGGTDGIWMEEWDYWIRAYVGHLRKERNNYKNRTIIAEKKLKDLTWEDWEDWRKNE